MHFNSFDMVNQLAMFYEIKKSLGNNQAVCKEWSGAQSCYCTCDSMTVHPMVLIFAEDSAIRREFVIMSDYLKHVANAVSTFMGKLGAGGEKRYSRIDELIVFGDCCGHQHKSRKPMYHLIF